MRAAILLVSLFITANAGAGQLSCAAKWWRTFTPYNATTLHGVWPSGKFPSESTCQEAYLHGEIVKGDYDRVAAFIAVHHPFLVKVYISSPGGDAKEAIRIGRLLRKYLIELEAPQYLSGVSLGLSAFVSKVPFGDSYYKTELCKDGPECICASACAFIWYGGAERSGRIGLHRLRAAAQYLFGALPSDEATKWYAAHSSELRGYLTEMEVPQNAIDKIFSISSGDILWQDHDESERSPSFAEWQDAACGYRTKEEYDELIRLRMKKGLWAGAPNKLTLLEGLLKEKLEERWEIRNNCLAKQKFNALDVMPGPLPDTIPDLDLLLEAERRGVELPAEDARLLQLARERGMAPPPLGGAKHSAAPTTAPEK